MEPKERGKRFVKVKDTGGHVWLCPVDALKRAAEATPDELENCVEWEVVAHTAGDIEAER